MERITYSVQYLLWITYSIEKNSNNFILIIFDRLCSCVLYCFYNWIILSVSVGARMHTSYFSSNPYTHQIEKKYNLSAQIIWGSLILQAYTFYANGNRNELLNSVLLQFWTRKYITSSMEWKRAIAIIWVWRRRYVFFKNIQKNSNMKLFVSGSERGFQMVREHRAPLMQRVDPLHI